MIFLFELRTVLVSGRIVDTPKGHSAFIIEGGGPGASLGEETQGEVKMRASHQMRQVIILGNSE